MDIIDEREKISLNPGIVLNIEHKKEVGNVISCDWISLYTIQLSL